MNDRFTDDDFTSLRDLVESLGFRVRKNGDRFTAERDGCWATFRLDRNFERPVCGFAVRKDWDPEGSGSFESRCKEEVWLRFLREVN